MPTDISRQVSTTLVQDLVRFRLGGEDEPTCNRCGGVLELEQPNLRNPRKLLGVCQQCGLWEVIEILELGESAWVTTLPGEFWPGETPSTPATAPV